MNDAWFVRVFDRPLLIHLLGAGVFVCLFAPVGYFLILPLRESHAVSAQKAEQLASIVKKNRRTLGELDQLRLEFAKTEERAEAIRQRIPASRQEAELLEKLSQLAQRTNLEIVDYRRGAVSDGEQFSRVQIELQCEGTFASICKFLDAVNKLERLTTVDRLQIEASSESQRYPTDMSIALYYRHHENATARRDSLPLNEKVVQ